MLVHIISNIIIVEHQLLSLNQWPKCHAMIVGFSFRNVYMYKLKSIKQSKLFA